MKDIDIERSIRMSAEALRQQQEQQGVKPTAAEPKDEPYGLDAISARHDELANHLDRQLAGALLAVARFGSPRQAATFAAQSLAGHIGLAQMPAFQKHIEDAIMILRIGNTERKP